MTKEEKEKQLMELELRKIKALEKIGNSLDSLTIWFEDIDKSEWSERIQFYLHEYYKRYLVDDVYKKGDDVE